MFRKEVGFRLCGECLKRLASGIYLASGMTSKKVISSFNDNSFRDLSRWALWIFFPLFYHNQCYFCQGSVTTFSIKNFLGILVIFRRFVCLLLASKQVFDIHSGNVNMYYHHPLQSGLLYVSIPSLPPTYHLEALYSKVYVRVVQ